MGKITGRNSRSGRADLQLDLAALTQTGPNVQSENYYAKEVYVTEEYEEPYEARYERPRRKQKRLNIKVLGIVFLAVALLVFLIWDKKPAEDTFGNNAGNDYANSEEHPEWKTDYLTISGYARPGTALKEVNNIFVHYTANPGTSAVQNRSYFENLRKTKERAASAHFIIGYDGEIINCIPTNEMAYAVVGRNEDSVSIECCYKDESGIFTEETYESLVELLGWLLETYDLESEDILRHYDEGGKMCPLYYVEHEDAWEQLKKDVEEQLKK